MTHKLVSSLILLAMITLSASTDVKAQTRAQQYRDTHFRVGVPGSADRAEQHTPRKVHKPRDHWLDNRRHHVHPGLRTNRHPTIGQKVDRLPKRYKTMRRRHHQYHHHNGTFYQPVRNGHYIVVRPPLGARFSKLPDGYFSFNLGKERYFYLNYAYYLWHSPSRRYVIVEKPDGAERALINSSHAAVGKVYIYPKQGQSEAQREKDRYDCYLWAIDETGFDPGADNYRQRSSRDYRRALTACLEGRGYSVK